MLGSLAVHATKYKDNIKLLKIWNISNNSEAVKIYTYCHNGGKITKSYDPAAKCPETEGAIKLTAISAPEKSGYTKLQVSFIYSGKIIKGKQYRISFYCKSIKPVRLQLGTIMAEKPWT
jgi:hypothetical protein